MIEGHLPLAKTTKHLQTAIMATENSRPTLLEDSQVIARILNAIKNERRVSILQLLQENPHSEKEIRNGLRSMGHKHSLTTIRGYLQPLVEAELAVHKHGKYSTTARGYKVLQLVGKTNFLLRFPSNSSCHEELSLIAIKNSYRTIEELAKMVDRPVLPRTLNRLQRQGLVQSNHPREHAQFYRVRARLHGNASPTERRVFHALNQEGISVRDLSKAVGITVRRTYKYLARLRKKGLALQRILPVTYALTSTGRIVADFIEEIIAQALDRPRRIILTPRVDSDEFGVRSPLAIIQQYGGNGILQSELWRRLGIDSRRGSRQVLNLERRGFVERRKELSRGRWTFRIFPRRRAATVGTIASIPCASCDDDFRGICPTHTTNPATCSRLTHWLIDIDRESLRLAGSD